MQHIRSTIRIVGVAGSGTGTGTVTDVPEAANVNFYVDPASGLRVLIKGPNDGPVPPVPTQNVVRHRGTDNSPQRPRDELRPSSTHYGRGVTSSCQTYESDSRHNHGRNDQSGAVTMRDQSNVSKGRRKKKIFRKSQTVPEDLCYLDTGEGQQNDHSTKTKKRTKKSKRHCDIHGSRRGSSGTMTQSLDTSRDGTTNLSGDVLYVVAEGSLTDLSRATSTESLVCTCKPKRSKRPEPEGRSFPFPKHMSEYDRVIYNDDPIFSDCDDDEDPSKDEQIRTEAERYHKRTHHSDMFAAAQMVNTNTMLKFAIIGTELQNIIQVSLKRSEGEVQALTRRIRLLEEDFEQTETRLQSASEKLEEASKAADESERNRKALESTSLMNDEKLDILETQLKEAKYISEDADHKYDEADA